MLRPTEFIYLKTPLWSDGGKMITLTLQELCMKGVLAVEERWVYVGRSNHERRRFYLLKGKFFDSYQTELKSEQFLLSCFHSRDEVSFSSMRYFVTSTFNNDPTDFKWQYVYPDLKKKGLCANRYFLTNTGREEKRALKQNLSRINSDIDILIRDAQQLQAALEAIGPNIILLDQDVIEKLQNIDGKILELALVSFFPEFNTLTELSTFADIGSIGNFDFTDASFDFGGGEFGGGGSGGDW